MSGTLSHDPLSTGELYSDALLQPIARHRLRQLLCHLGAQVHRDASQPCPERVCLSMLHLRRDGRLTHASETKFSSA